MTILSFPAIGHIYEANFGTWSFHLSFVSAVLMVLTPLTGPMKGISETVRIVVTPIRSDLFIISWQEADQTTVVQVHDYENGIVYTNVTEPNGVFLLKKGTLTQY